MLENAFNPNGRKVYSRRTVYDLLNEFKLYQSVSDIIYHLNIMYVPAVEVLNKISPNHKYTAEEGAKLLAKTIKMCDIGSPFYNAEVDRALTNFGINYSINNTYSEYISEYVDNLDKYMPSFDTQGTYRRR